VEKCTHACIYYLILLNIDISSVYRAGGREAFYELFSHYYCITIADFRLVLAEGMASSAPPIMIELNDDKVLTLFRYMSELYRPARKPSKAK
jgi:hypothetical protein